MDDLSSLDFSSGTGQQPAKPTGRSAFDYLSSGGRYHQPQRPSAPQAGAQATSASLRQGAVSPNGSKAAAGSGDQDAFSSLFGGGSSAAGAGKSRSMADQLAAQNQTRYEGAMGFSLSPSSSSMGGRAASPALLAPNRVLSLSPGGSRSACVRIVLGSHAKRLIVSL